MGTRTVKHGEGGPRKAEQARVRQDPRLEGTACRKDMTNTSDQYPTTKALEVTKDPFMCLHVGTSTVWHPHPMYTSIIHAMKYAYGTWLTHVPGKPV